MPTAIFKIIEKDYCYYKEEADRRIILIRSTKNDKKREKMEMDLLKSVSDVMRKNINNFKKLCNNTNLIFDEEDVEVEAYIMFKNCIENFKLSPTNSFYFYLNKSLNQNFFVLYKKKLKEREENSKIESDSIRLQKMEIQHYPKFDLMNFNLSKIGFSKMEMDIIESRYIGQTKDDFLKINLGFSNSNYDSCLKNIKSKLTKHKSDLL
jgi:hypothetical protein